MNKKELFCSVLERMGYKPETDENGNLFFRFQMKQLVAFISSHEEDNYIALLLPQFHDVEEGEESLALAACNKLTRELKFIKVFADQTLRSISASCEFYFTDEASLEECIRQSFRMLGLIRRHFRSTWDELKS